MIIDDLPKDPESLAKLLKQHEVRLYRLKRKAAKHTHENVPSSIIDDIMTERHAIDAIRRRLPPEWHSLTASGKQADSIRVLTNRFHMNLIRRLPVLAILGTLFAFLGLYFGPDLPEPEILGNDGMSVFIEPKSMYPVIAVCAEIATEPPAHYRAVGTRYHRPSRPNLWLVDCKILYTEAHKSTDQCLKIRIYAKDIRLRWGSGVVYTVKPSRVNSLTFHHVIPSTKTMKSTLDPGHITK